jgi:hypothetical protein
MRFHDVLGTIYAQVDNLQVRNMILRCTRDRLLPRLVSGALDVAGLAINGAPQE